MRLSASRSGRIWTWLLITAFVAIGFGWFGGGRMIVQANRLRASSTHVPGTITSVTAGNSLNGAAAYYEFAVDGQKRYGYSQVSNRLAGTLGPGNPVMVTYLPEDPSTTCLDPEGIAAQGRTGMLLAFIVELVMAAVFIPLILTAGRDQLKRDSGQSVSAMIVIGILALVGLSALVFGLWPSYSQAQALVAHGAPIQAQITGVYDGDRGRYAEYTYAVADVYYHGKAGYKGGYGDRGTIQIYYLPEQPGFSARDPQQNLRDVRFGGLFMLVWLSLVAIIGAAIYSRTRAMRNLR